MKIVKSAICAILLIFLCTPVCRSQDQEIKQLLLNIEKLGQFKKILSDLYKGYKILYNGYTTIKNISEGNFNIHKVFLEALLDVSPAVKKYKRVADIIDYEIRIVKAYKGAYNQFKQDNNFSPEEIEYMGRVYGRISDLCLQNLDDLAMVITAGKLRMSDDERIVAIDKIYADVEDEWSFLAQFNSTAKLLSFARTRDQIDINLSKKIIGVK